MNAERPVSELLLAERRRIASEIEKAADAYMTKWTPIVGEDRAKAGAWDILLLAKNISDGA